MIRGQMFDRAEPDPNPVALVTPIPAPSSAELTTSRILDALALLVVGIVGVLALLTFRDYGLGWDDYTHAEYADLLLKLYGSGFKDTARCRSPISTMYGGGFDMLAALAAQADAAQAVRDPPLAWRGRRNGRTPGDVAAGAARAGRSRGSRRCAARACPTFYGHMFMNPKDAPFAVAMVIFLLGLVRAVRNIPRSLRPEPSVGIGAGLVDRLPHPRRVRADRRDRGSCP